MQISDINNDFIESSLSSMDAEEILKWSFENFGTRAAIGSSFQLTGSVIIDITSKTGLDFRVFTVDTLRLHDETYKVMEEVESKYGIKVERFAPDKEKLDSMVSRFGEYLFFDSKAKQEYCCEVRKVEPNDRALDTVDVWISGLRNDQSKSRKNISKVEMVVIKGRDVLKINPLVNWSVDEIKKYIADNNVPYNKLFDEGYDSIGCTICSTPLNEGEAPRSGRWRWFNGSDDNKECGIHIPKKGGK